MTANLQRPTRLGTVDRGGGGSRVPGSSPPGDLVRVAVCADHALVSEAVAAALGTHGLRVWPMGKPSRRHFPAAERDVVDVGLLLNEIDPDRLWAMRQLIERHTVRWLLVTGSPRGPLWGAAVEAGVDAILPSTVTGDEVADAVCHLARGDDVMERADRDRLLRLWREDQVERRRTRERLATLTPRERSVLELIYLGESVRSISELYGVSQSTVRSQVRAVLRKLELNSQLGAAAVWARHRDEAVPQSAAQR